MNSIKLKDLNLFHNLLEVKAYSVRPSRHTVFLESYWLLRRPVNFLILWNPKIYRFVREISAVDPTFGQQNSGPTQLNSVHNFRIRFFKIRYNSARTCNVILELQNGYFSWFFRTKWVCEFIIIYSMPSYPIFFDLIALTLFGEVGKYWISLFEFLHHFITSFPGWLAGYLPVRSICPGFRKAL